MLARNPATPRLPRPRPLAVGLLVAGLIAAGLLIGWSLHSASVPQSSTSGVGLETDDPSARSVKAPTSDLQTLVEQVESDFESDELTYDVVDRSGTRSGAVIAATAEVLVAWTSKSSEGRELAAEMPTAAVLVWCNLRLKESDPLQSLILFEEYDPICERPRRPLSRLLPGAKTWTWRERLTRWNGLSAVGIPFFDRDTTLQDVLHMFNQKGEETPGALYPLVSDGRDLKTANSMVLLRPHVAADVWERRIGPLSELPRNGPAP